VSQLAANHEAFVHVRMIVGVVVGLGVGRLLTGLARFVQHPSRETIYPVHLGWALFVLLGIAHFWWFEYRLSAAPVWSFQLYLFLIFYACLLFLATTLLFPDKMDEYAGYRDYFMSRRRWFFGLLALIFIVDFADTSLKGGAYLDTLGPVYPYRNAGFILAFALGAFSSDRRLQAALVSVALAAQLSWIFWLYDVL